MSSAAVALRDADALLRELEAADRFSGVVGVEQGDQKLLLEAFGDASRTWSIPTRWTPVSNRLDNQAVTAVATLSWSSRVLALDTWPSDLGLEERNLARGHALPPADPHLGHRRRADQEAGESYENLPRAAQLPGHGDGGLPPAVVGKPANFAPGQRCRYCNVGYVLLGLMIEGASG